MAKVIDDDPTAWEVRLAFAMMRIENQEMRVKALEAHIATLALSAPRGDAQTDAAFREIHAMAERAVASGCIFLDAADVLAITKKAMAT